MDLHGNTSVNILEDTSRNILYVYEQLTIFLYIKFLFRSIKLMFFFFFFARDMNIPNLSKQEVLMNVSGTALASL